MAKPKYSNSVTNYATPFQRELIGAMLVTGVTREEMARELVVSPHTIRNWEYGRAVAHNQSLVSLQTFFAKRGITFQLFTKTFSKKGLPVSLRAI